ncbi:chemotaxis protein CheA [Hydrogenothermus marinus]|uniref:histidine kinase n=1 Tax=Hydrogenothermus marinus TaxID=133270 RepID=A0A3M0BML5_9AQUI|nr:chemotaxis protein CheA [Hydrogenothermus marinus]RMA97509.1 two-component system chemotaxis sensor kinase CheA [Hydrogenothermus marinus]
MKVNIPEDMQEILSEFLVEADEIVEQLDNDLIELEENPEDVNLLNKIFREIHTLKGGAGFLNLTTIVEIAHKIEDIFNKLRNNELKLTSSMMDVILEGIDKLKEGLERLKEEDEIPDEEEIQDIVLKLQAILEGKEIENRTSDSTENSKFSQKGFEESIANFVFKEGVDDDIKELILKFGAKDLAELLEDIILLPPDERPSLETIEKLEKLVNEGKDIKDLIEIKETKSESKKKPKEELKVEEKPKEKQKVSEKPVEKKAAEKKKKAEKKEDVIRVDVERVETLMNLVGELVLDRNRIVKLASILHAESKKEDSNIETLLEAITAMSRTVSDLQDAIMKLRMQPVKKIFSKFPRIVRDLAKKLNKKVQLILEGEDTEIDRSILDKLEDPLIHLVRNAIDHGIETPEERLKAGKPEVGTIVLGAYQEGDRIIIYIEDDGKGIDPEKVKQKAIEKGLITPEQAENMSDKEAYELIFMPGFSTVEKVSEVSGRGVGMDVVASTIHALRGNIEIESELGRGTKIIMKLPLTVAIIRTLMVAVNDRIFAIPLFSVVEIVRYKPENVKQVGHFKSLLLRDEVYILFNLNELFEIEDKKEKKYVVIVKVGEKNIAIAVEELFGEEEIVIKPLGDLLEDVKGIAGATITGDGKVVLIVDPNSLINDMKNQLVGVI